MSLRPNGVSDPSWLGKRIDTRPLFGPELASLLDVLRGLRRNEWSRAAVPGWTVHDLAAHILGDYQGRLGWSTESGRTPFGLQTQGVGRYCPALGSRGEDRREERTHTFGQDR
jgi:hypothetical protein